MTLTDTNPAALVECPKCCGVGNFRNWRHIANGDCFLCGSAKTVTVAEAGRWLASQVDRAPVAEPVTAPVDGLQRRTVDVPGLGSCRMTRWDDGEIRVDLPARVMVRGTAGQWLIIRVTDGIVRPVVVCDGMRPAADLVRQVVGHLQAALRG